MYIHYGLRLVINKNKPDAERTWRPTRPFNPQRRHGAPGLPMREHADNMAKPTKEKKKKDAQLVLRLNKDLRDRFVEACQDLDTSAAREVRRFIKKFLKRYEDGEFDD